ncbi:MAG TPA: hypothetical protein VG735_03940 [Caulobacterales bacterium]|nr:hypothetical protein [Caulobacterales bacterium]
MARVDSRAIVALLQTRVKRVLDFAELAVPADKFERFRTLVLDEFGHKGFQSDLAAHVPPDGTDTDRHGMGRSESGRKGGPR